VQRLLVSSRELTPGQTVTVAAGRLNASVPHAARFVLQGPGYRAQRLVETRFGVAAGDVTLPTSMAAGQWALAVEDLSQLHAAAHHELRGTAIVDIGIFSVK
jgi:hypothetical protein